MPPRVTRASSIASNGSQGASQNAFSDRTFNNSGSLFNSKSGSTRRNVMAAEKISANAHAAGPASYFLEPMAPVGFNNSTSEDDSYGAEEEYVRRSRAAAAAKTTRGRAKKDTLHDPRYADDAFRPYREDTDDDSGAGDGPVLPLRAQRARKAKDVPKPYLGSSTAQKNGSVAPPTITRGDGQSSSVFPVIPEETASPAPVPVPARRTPMTHGRTYAPETRNALFVDDWTSPFGTARKWHNQNKMVSVGIAFVAIVTGLGYVVSRLGGSGSSPAGYVAPTEIPSSMEELTERVVIMESHLQGLATQFHDTTGDVRDLTDLVNKIKVDVHNVADRQKTQGSSIKVLEGDMAALKHRMDALENSIRATLDDGRLASALEKILPRSLPVRYHKGSLVIDPAFYTELKKVFVGEGEMEKRVRSLINLGVEAPGKGDQGWRIDKYQKELEGLTTRMFERLSSERNYDERFLQRDEFVELVRKELNMHRNDIKVTAGMLKGSQVTIKAANGQDMSPAIQSLIDAALLKYSKDTIGMPDYALFTAGARPIKDLTSDSVMIYKPSAVGQWLGYTGIGNGPQIALSADNSVGNCWSFNTGEGRLGIQLARPVVVTSISIDHASHDLTFSQTSAPKTVEVWAHIPEEHQAKAKEYLEFRDRMAAPLEREPAPTEETPESLLLASFTYDANLDAPIQTFPVPADLVATGIDVQSVVVLIKSNWGGEYTCLYRVRVHGDEPAAAAAA